MEPNLSQALHLINGPTVTQKIVDGKLIERRLSEEKSPQEIVEELYVRCLSRKPTAFENEQFNALLDREGADPKSTLEDIFWALLNSREFMFNH